MGRHDLAAVDEVRLEPVVVRRVVARRDYGAGVGAYAPHGEAQLRGRPGPVEDERVAPELGPDRRGELAKVPREEPDVVRYHEARRRALALPAEVTLRVAEQPDHRPCERHVVQEVAPDPGVLRRPVGARRPGLRAAGDRADRSAAHAARAELELAVEAVVQLA